MEICISKEEVSELALKLKAGPENGDSVVVFYVDEKVFGITSAKALLSLDGGMIENIANLQTFQRMKTKYGDEELDIIYLYRGKILFFCTTDVPSSCNFPK